MSAPAPRERRDHTDGDETMSDAMTRRPPMTDLAFKVGDFAKTRDGRRVTITGINPDEPYAICGIIDGDHEEDAWTLDGRYFEDEGSQPDDLIGH
jgi:hypothetical protein